MSLSDVVNISISRTTKVPTRASFGTLAFVCYHALNANLVNEVREADEVLDLGATVAHPAYRAAVMHFSQEPRPEKMLIVKRQTFTQILHLTPVNLTVGFKYEFTIVSPTGVEHPIEHTVVTGTVDAIVDALVTAITTAAPSNVTPTPSGVTATHLILTGAAGVIFRLKNLPNPADMLVYDATVAGTTAADVTAFLGSLQAPQAYALAFDRAGEAEVMAAAAVIEAQRKMLFVDTCDSEVVNGADTDDVGSQLKALNYARTVPFYLSNACGELQSVGHTGRCLPYDPGSETWAHKTIKGIAADDLFSGQLTALETKRVGAYVNTGGLDATRWGQVPDGDYIDVIRGVDWLYARIGEAVWTVLYSLPKVPFNDFGIAVVESTVRAVLESAVRVGLINKGYTITVPKVSEVEAADKAARTLPDVKFSAVLAGAIHKVRITGNVSL
jgi:hypothetical protein